MAFLFSEHHTTHTYHTGIQTRTSPTIPIIDTMSASASASSSWAAVSSSSAADHHNVALYSYREGDKSLVLEATFHHHRTLPRGDVLMAFFGSEFGAENNEAETRVRAWPFSSSRRMTQMLAEGSGWNPLGKILMLAVWRGTGFYPLAKLPATADLRDKHGSKNDVADEVISCARSRFREACAPISYVLVPELYIEEGYEKWDIVGSVVFNVLGLLVKDTRTWDQN